jgi:hypothetical protein
MAYKDVVLKYLSHVSPYEIAKFVGVDTEIVESLSEEIKNIRISDLHADFVLRADNDILHVEFQQEMKSDTLRRFYVYNALLTRQFERVVDTYIVYLGKGKIPTPIIEGKMVKFTPALIRVADMDAAEVLKNAKSGNGNIIAMALMPLMKNCTKEKMVELIDTEARINSEGLRNDVIASTLLMSSTVYEEGFIRDMKRRLIQMYDVDIFKEERKAALEEGMTKGKFEGKIEGKLEALREDVSKLLLIKFKDSYTSQMREYVKKADKDTLEYIRDHIFDIRLEEVKKILFVS